MNLSQTKIHASAAIRFGTLADADGIEALERASFEWAPEDAFSRRQIMSLLRNPRAMVRVASAKKKVLGWGAALVRRHAASSSGRIYAIAVHPDAQGLRLGRRLMKRMILDLRSRRVRRIFLEVDEKNKPAIALYLKLGFMEIRRSKHYYGVGRHALHFRLKIAE